MRTRSILRVSTLPVLVAFGLFGAACGGDDDGETSPASTVDDSAPSTVAADESDVDAYCDASRVQDSMSDDFDAFTDPVALEAFFVDSLDQVDQRIAVAPDEIRKSLIELRALNQSVIDIVEANEWDYPRAIPEIAPLLDDPERNAIDQIIDEFDSVTCGIVDDANDTGDNDTGNDATGDNDTGNDAGGTTADGSPALDAEAFRMLIETDVGRQLLLDDLTEGGLTEEQATCFIDEGFFMEFYEIGLSAEPPTASQASLLFETMDVCDIPSSYFDN